MEKYWSSTYEGDHDDTASALCDLGCAHFLLGAYSTANDEFEESLRMYRVFWGESHHAAGVCLSNLAATQHQLGNYTIALDLVDKSLKEHS